MPETLRENTHREIPAEEIAESDSPRARTAFFSTAYSSAALLAEPISTGPLANDPAVPGNESKDLGLPWFRINWEIKALAGAGAVAICGALLVVLTYTVQRPMVELQQKIAQLGGGDLSVAVSFAQRNDEIGDLGRNFNQMVQQLREGRAEIELLHRTQMSRAEHLATLGELATGLAHEIRNPLAGIAGVIEIISRDLPATSPARSVVKDVRQEIARINHIVTDLLQTARPHPPTVRKSDLNTTVEHAVMLGRQQALAKSIEISFHKDPSLPEVEHDSDQIHQLLLNLLLNALQAIDLNGKITVRVKPHGSEAMIEVADNGRGIAPDQLPNIFRPFYTTKGDGTGLGLSLARRIVEDHQGRIDVTSALGQGTTFAVILPLHRAPNQNPAA